MLDGRKGGNKETIIELSPKVIYASAKFPVPFTGPITKKSMRTRRRISFEQFPVNCANARTVHKLQGRSMHHLVVSAWDYTDNWVYVCLSRCTTMKGLFLREPLNPSKTKAMAEEFKLDGRSSKENFREPLPHTTKIQDQLLLHLWQNPASSSTPSHESSISWKLGIDQWFAGATDIRS
ncbi:hypothetical protein IV203_026189 [Nitzschia inconspicua]|uniref:Uncharacterized protein n=1 Tax=Nitzschia inconspicua TaxID=303405 RepID=A0A9K3LJ94_9STRA|nr:hypothetical protein IV203_026189 [Nitzschia inconspicua]